MNGLPCSGNAFSDDPGVVADYSCYRCDRRATGYLFMSVQFCDEHRPELSVTPDFFGRCRVTVSPPDSVYGAAP